MSGVIASRTIQLIQRNDGKFFRSGYDSPDTWVSNPFDATDVSDYVYLRDAKRSSVGEIVELRLSATFTGNKEKDLYINGESIDCIDQSRFKSLDGDLFEQKDKGGW